MNITRESTGELTAQVRIEIGPADYAEAVDKQISEFKRKANLPGFRPGHVPTGLVRKMYGKAILAEEVNKLLSDSLMQYIRDEKIDILGHPLPNTEKSPPIDFETQETFEFYFDLGLTPQFTVPVDQDLGIEHYTITISDEMTDKYIEDTRKQFGTPATGGEAEEKTETGGPADENQAAPAPEIIPAGMNPEFFEKVYPGMNLETEEDFRAQVRADATRSFGGESEKLLFDDITRALVKHTEMPLPDEFLKRWLLENNEGKYTPEEIESNYTSFAESMKWQLIENRLIRDQGIAVSEEEIRGYIKTYFLRQLNMENADPEMSQRYESIVDTLMQNKEQVQRINDQLYNAKLMDYFKSSIIMHPKEVTYEEYIRIVSSRHPREDHSTHHHHHHDHDHDHDHDHGDHSH